jgi:hypothetical protein
LVEVIDVCHRHVMRQVQSQIFRGYRIEVDIFKRVERRSNPYARATTCQFT